MKRWEKVLLVLFVLALFVLAGCSEDLRTDAEHCLDNSTEYLALAQCSAAYPVCRLNDNEWRRFKVTGLNTLMYCARAEGGVKDKEVQPKPKDETTA